MARILQKQIIAQLGVKQKKHSVDIPDRVWEVREQIRGYAKEIETAMARDKKNYSTDVYIFKETANLLEKSCAGDAWLNLNSAHVRNNKARDYKFNILPHISALMPNCAGGNYRLEKACEIASEERSKIAQDKTDQDRTILILCKGMNSSNFMNLALCWKTGKPHITAALKHVEGSYDVIINMDANLNNRGILLKHIKNAGTMHEIVTVEPKAAGQKKSKFAQKNLIPDQIQH